MLVGTLGKGVKIIKCLKDINKDAGFKFDSLFPHKSRLKYENKHF